MKSFLYAAVFFVISAFISGIFYRPYEWLVVILATVLGFAIGRISQLQKDLNSLRDTMARDWEVRNNPQAQTRVNQQPVAEATSQKETKPQDFVPDSPFAQSSLAPDTKTEAAVKSAVKTASTDSSSYALPTKPGIFDRARQLLKDYFTGGNLFVRVGIILLFFGVSFLLKFASDKGFFPIEYRLMAVAIGAIGLLAFGWYLRNKKPTYALLLQGAGVGILYLNVFAAFSMYKLIPALPAFALLFVISMLSAALAVLQNSRSMAVLGFSGGFLAPILASSSSNNYIGQFSYYLLLNVAIVAIAWFKAWRELNLLGFVFTFVIGSWWGVTSYRSENFATVEPFLTAFFLLYVLIAVLFALRQPPKLRGYVDGSLLFGVPLAASSLQYALVKDFEYGVSISSFAIGVFYLTFAWILWKRAGQGLRLLSEAFLALGVIFTSLAIPFALSPTHSSAAWALEGLGLIWLGSRQNRLSVRIFGLLLQFGAGALLAISPIDRGTMPFVNGAFISAAMMSVAGLLSARLLAIDFEGRRRFESVAANILLVWGLWWLFGGFIDQIYRHYGYQWLGMAVTLLASAVSLVFMLAGLKTKPQWHQAWWVSLIILPVLLFTIMLYPENMYLSIQHDYPFKNGGWLSLPIGFAVLYLVLYQLDQHKIFERFRGVFHTLSMVLLLIVATWEGLHQLAAFLSMDSGWARVWFALPASIALWLIIKANVWPFGQNRQNYLQLTGTVISVYLILWGFQAVVAKGNSDPLPWIPLLNPLDIMLVTVLMILYKWWLAISDEEMFGSVSKFKPNTTVFAVSIAALTFLWLNFTLFRIASHWFEVPYTVDGLYNSNLVQTSVSVLWAVCGVMLTIFASRQQLRTVWIVGGILLGLVVIKLFTIDLSSISSIARIVSFLVVGALLTSIGYFAPLPEKDQQKLAQQSMETEDANNENA